MPSGCCEMDVKVTDEMDRKHEGKEKNTPSRRVKSGGLRLGDALQLQEEGTEAVDTEKDR